MGDAKLMKLIRAVVKPHKLDPVHAALVEVGVTDLTASEVKGFDRQMGHAEMHRGTEYRIAFMPMVKIEAVVTDELVEPVMEAIRRAAGTNQDDDGKISVCEVVGTRRIHGGETGEAAL